MRRHRLALRAALCAVLALAAPAHAAAPATAADSADVWRPWTRLLAADPFAIPRAAGALRGVTPASRCGAPGTDLAAAVARLGAATHRSDTLNPNLRLPAATSAYLASLTDCLAAHSAHLPAYDGEYSGPAPDALRAQWLGTVTDLLALVEHPPALPESDVRSACVDVLCLVQTGGTGSDTYTANAALIVDQGGTDTYRNNAGGGDPLHYTIPAALVLDLGTAHDEYVPEASDLYAAPTNGGGVDGGVGIVVDQGGDDHYCGLGGTMGAGFSGAGLLLDLAGNDYYESYDPDADSTGCPWHGDGSVYGNSHKVDHGGAAYGGFGFLVDGGGNDTYLNYGVDSLGWGGAGGTGVLVDASGADTYAVYGAITTCGVGTCDVNNSGVSIGMGEVGGVGVVLDGGSGGDSYACYEQINYGCQGAAALGGVLGLVFDDGGNDTHYIAPTTDSGVLGGARIGGLGAAEGGGVGIFVDAGGNDGYTSADPSSVGYGDAGTGLFLDLGGTDTYSVPSTPTVGSRTNGGTWVAGIVGIGKDL